MRRRNKINIISHKIVDYYKKYHKIMWVSGKSKIKYSLMVVHSIEDLVDRELREISI